MKEDGRKNNGGNKNAGRKSKADEEKAKELIKLALNKIYSKNTDDENIILFLKDFSKTSRGQQFIAEHLLGKPKDNLNVTGDLEFVPITINKNYAS